jgi:hypothetical protein
MTNGKKSTRNLRIWIMISGSEEFFIHRKRRKGRSDAVYNISSRPKKSGIVERLASSPPLDLFRFSRPISMFSSVISADYGCLLVGILWNIAYRPNAAGAETKKTIP